MGSKKMYICGTHCYRRHAFGHDDEGGGYVKGVVTYMVMDDLGVKPMSTTSSVSILKKLNVKDVGVLEERTVKLGLNEI
ncbi:hypothetical protein PanWU01x14_042860 [Parasponia andersonii]|uniref:Uncharacterized protein n=1 Tax=Parasponia andersonii TaxID=3476 RepID=A0A2P5DPY2_PARAD|nr:hypothetical protein PanWU01x14_042860 [Parasponia andersonii]